MRGRERPSPYNHGSSGNWACTFSSRSWAAGCSGSNSPASRPLRQNPPIPTWSRSWPISGQGGATFGTFLSISRWDRSRERSWNSCETSPGARRSPTGKSRGTLDAPGRPEPWGGPARGTLPRSLSPVIGLCRLRADSATTRARAGLRQNASCWNGKVPWPPEASGISLRLLRTPDTARRSRGPPLPPWA